MPERCDRTDPIILLPRAQRFDHAQWHPAKNLVLLDISSDVTAFIAQEIPELQEEAAYLQLVTYLKLLKEIMDEDFYSYPMAQKRILAYVQDQQDLIRQPWAKRADKIKVKTLRSASTCFTGYMNWPNEKMHGI